MSISCKKLKKNSWFLPFSDTSCFSIFPYFFLANCSTGQHSKCMLTYILSSLGLLVLMMANSAWPGFRCCLAWCLSVYGNSRNPLVVAGHMVSKLAHHWHPFADIAKDYSTLWLILIWHICRYLYFFLCDIPIYQNSR